MSVFLDKSESAIRQAIAQGNKAAYAELAMDCFTEIVAVVQAAQACRDLFPRNKWAFQEDEDDLNEALQALDAIAKTSSAKEKGITP